VVDVWGNKRDQIINLHRPGRLHRLVQLLASDGEGDS
jgi:hypothetical protein